MLPGFCWVQHDGQRYSSPGRASTISSSRTPQIGQRIGCSIESVESGIGQGWDTILFPFFRRDWSSVAAGVMRCWEAPRDVTSSAEPTMQGLPALRWP
jgi:hypothetical protein